MDTDSRTVWVGNLSDKVTEELLFELFLQAGPLERVRIPTDRDGRKSNFAFVTFKHDQSVDYAAQLLSGISMFDRRLNIKPRNNNGTNQRSQEEEVKVVQNPWSNTLDLLRLGQMMQLSYKSHQNQTHYDNYHGGREEPVRQREERRREPYKAYRDDRHNNNYGSHGSNRHNRSYNNYRDRRQRQY